MSKARTELHLSGANKVKIAIRSDGRAILVEVDDGLKLFVTEIIDLAVVDYREQIWSDKNAELQ